ncbi:MAG: hypothetical protein U0670_01860 [Anaerolineae bacterium]
MHHKRLMFFLPTSGLLMITLGLLLVLGQPVDAQCGSQASSCKNCHEVQAQDPVNADGTGWHESHAFGDFCYICHAGNPQAADEAAAHEGMVPPLSDVQAGCQSCHPDDLEARAQVYATTLGVSFSLTGDDSSGGSSGDSSSSGSDSTSDTSSPSSDTSSTDSSADSSANSSADTAAPVDAATSLSAPTDREIALDDPNMVDYVQRYNEIVLGERPVNMGNIVLVVLIGVVVLGGGVFIILNEMRRMVVATETKQAQGEYPADVVDMLPLLSRLSLDTRKALGKLLQNPKKTEAVVNVVKSVDPIDDSQGS